MQARVSVIVPVYNAAPYLSDTLQSLQRQTYREWEAWIVDDGSTDGSLRIARSFAERDSRFAVLAGSRSGASAARNRAFACCRGELIQYLDADDLLHPEKLATQVACYTGGRRTVLYGPATLLKDGKRRQPTYRIYRQYPSPRRLLREMWYRAEPLLLHTVMVTRDLVESSGGWDETLSCNDDGEFVARLLLHAEKALYTPQSRACYRIDSVGSLSRSATPECNRSLCASVLACLEHAEKSGEDFSRELESLLTYVIVLLYGRDPELAEELATRKRRRGIEGYRYPKLDGLHRLLFSLLGLSRTARIHHLLRGLRI